MPSCEGSLKDRLTRYRQIKISVIGRKSQEVRADDLDSGLVRAGRQNLYLLPVQGSDTQWYKNVLKNPSIRIDARGVEVESQHSFAFHDRHRVPANPNIRDAGSILA